MMLSMVEKLGPDGRYPLGAPYDFSDQGHMNVSFEIKHEQRQAVLTFGTLLDWFILTPPIADTFVEAVRREITDTFGEVPYDVAKMRLPVRADRKRGVVEVRLPMVAGHLVGDPEFWLALTERIATARKRL